MILINNQEEICFVQGFVRKNSKKQNKLNKRKKKDGSDVAATYKLSSIQLKNGSESISNNKFLVSCQKYQVVNGYLEPSKVQVTLVELSQYKRHVYVNEQFCKI
jgi:hypothetical protein